MNSVITKLEQAKIPVVMVVSDTNYAGRLAYVGIDARLSGRIAADFASLVLDEGDETAVFVGAREVIEHARKADSYTASCKEKGLNVVSVCETQDDPHVAYHLTTDLLRRRPNLKLIYVATGNSIAVCRAICENRRQDSVRVIATDVPRELHAYVENGVVIGVLGQHLHTQGAVAVKTLYNYLTEGVLNEDEIMIAPDLMLKSAILSKWKQN